MKSKKCCHHKCEDKKIKGDLKVKKNLTVCGNIKNIQNELSRYCPPPPTQEVYDQQAQIFNAFVGEPVTQVPQDILMEEVQDLNVPLSERLEGVYGYLEDGTLSKDGGELYNSQVTGVDYKIHSVEPSGNLDITIEGFLESLPFTTEWMTQRGFQLAPPDTSASDQNTFNFLTNIYYRSENKVLINFKFHYEEESFIPSMMDLVALVQSSNANSGSLGLRGFTEYTETRPENDKFCYPIRFPVTTDKDVFAKKVKCRKSIAYYNQVTQQITIDTGDIDFVSFKNDNWPNNLTPIEYSLVINTMKGFKGKFQFTTRDRKNNLISSQPKTAQYLIQTSETIDVKCTELYENKSPEPQDLSVSIPFRVQSGRFAGQFGGIIASLLNGGSDAYDIYIINNGLINATANPLPSFITKPRHSGNQSFGEGDNPNTILIETLGLPSSYVIWDSTFWDEDDIDLTAEFLANPPIPEFASDPTKYPLVQVSPMVKVLRNVNSHEYMHSIQSGLSGLYSLIDGEAQATGIEFDPAVNDGDYFTFRTRDVARFLVIHSINSWPLLQTESEMDVGLDIGTYGQGAWWIWLKSQCDPLFQVMRRTNDILSSVYNQYQEQLQQLANSRLFYSGANRLACQQAINELIPGKNLSELYRDFGVTASLLRNNTSIPERFRYTYGAGVWTQQEAYPDNAIVAGFGGTNLETWWEEFDNNTIPSPAAERFNNRFPDLNIGDSLQSQLKPGDTPQLEFQDLSSQIYVVDPSIEKVTVTSDPTAYTGRIVVTMHQYLANVPDVNGTFKYESVELSVGDSHEFDVTQFDNGGLIRLVVSNISVTDFGGIDNLILDDSIDRITGKASVTTL